MKEQMSVGEIHYFSRVNFNYSVRIKLIEKNLPCPSAEEIDDAIEHMECHIRDILKAGFNLSNPKQSAEPFDFSKPEANVFYYRGLILVTMYLQKLAEKKDNLYEDDRLNIEGNKHVDDKNLPFFW